MSTSPSYKIQQLLLFKVISIVLILLISSKFTFSQGTITGTIVYANTALTPLHDSTLVKLYQGTTLIEVTTVDSAGNFTFDSIPDGSYTVKAQVNKKPGGFNALDSYLVLRNFCGLQPPLTGIYVMAADVNRSGGVPADVDEIIILRRFTHKLSMFCYPPDPNCLFNWVSETKSVTVTANTTQTTSVKVLCMGDVDGSFLPY